MSLGFKMTAFPQGFQNCLKMFGYPIYD
eukprot:UN19515